MFRFCNYFTTERTTQWFRACISFFLPSLYLRRVTAYIKNLFRNCFFAWYFHAYHIRKCVIRGFFPWPFAFYCIILVLRNELFRVRSSWRNSILFVWKFCLSLSFFYESERYFFRQVMLFWVLNDRHWSSLLRCITNVRIIVLPWCLQQRQTAKHLRFHSLFQKPYNKRLLFTLKLDTKN